MQDLNNNPTHMTYELEDLKEALDKYFYYVTLYGDAILHKKDDLINIYSPLDERYTIIMNDLEETDKKELRWNKEEKE